MAKNQIEENLIKFLQDNTMKTNVVAKLAFKDGRDYIMPEDITEALKDPKIKEDDIRRDVLQILAENAGFGAEDSGLCAFVAFEGRKKKAKGK